MASFFTNFWAFIHNYIHKCLCMCVCPYLLLIVCLFILHTYFFRDDHCIQDNKSVSFSMGETFCAFSAIFYLSVILCVRLSPQKLFATYMIYVNYIHYALFYFNSSWSCPSNFLLTLPLFILLITSIYIY